MNSACAYSHATEHNCMLYCNTLLLHKTDKMEMAGTSREISSVMTSAANNYNTRLDSNVRIKIRIRTEVTWNRIRANAYNSGNYETCDNARRTDRASTTHRLHLDYALASISCKHCRSSRNNPHWAPGHVIYYYLIQLNFLKLKKLKKY